MTIKTTLAILAIGVALVLSPQEAGAFNSGTTASKPSDTNLASGKKAVDDGDYATAVKYLRKAVEADSKNADGFNLLGFSYRKLGDTDAAFKQYHAALAIDRKHRGANEYIGELYLEQGNLAKAEEHLKILDGACSFGCEEYRELKAEIDAYKTAHGG